MATACCSLPGLSCAVGLASYNTGSTAAAPVTNILHGGQTVSTFSGLITCSNCSVNGYEFGQPGVPTPANLRHYTRGPDRYRKRRRWGHVDY